jgi:hypothetical protein
MKTARMAVDKSKIQKRLKFKKICLYRIALPM